MAKKRKLQALNRDTILNYGNQYGLDTEAICAILTRPEKQLFANVQKLKTYPLKTAQKLIDLHENFDCYLTVDAETEMSFSDYRAMLFESQSQFSHKVYVTLHAEQVGATSNAISLDATFLTVEEARITARLLNNIANIAERRCPDKETA